ncbi:MAG TPA: DUF6531 domain-containing protein [Candidatus Cybelea sp.]|jgi:YD repeat-containing protein|nr:DUF6531 domain-containing protein [Candidatus Cybelea sp.]
MQGLFRRAAASIVALVLLAPQTGGVSIASSPSRSALRAPYVAPASPPQRIPVKEPVRVKPAKPLVRPTSAKPVAAIRAHGVRVEGPRMLLPMEIDRPIASARRRALQRTPATTAVPARPSQPGRPIPQRPSTGAPSGPPGTRRAMSLPSDPNASGTGINPWWRYQEENVPGGGHVMVNVGTGNLLLQDDDMSVPHKGIAMAFRRAYNSQNAAATLVTAWGNFQSLYGNGWTNTFDARLISQSATLKSIYDIDGARYDYSYDSTTMTMTSLTPGQHASLVFDGNCGWLWTKKSGTTYYFYTMNPNAVVGCPSISTIGGYSGRLYRIIGRNRNTSITFNYSWDNGDASINGKISQITATTESGMTTTLSFADASGRRLLQQLTFPDGSTNVQYGYDASGNLIWVSRPPNNAAGTRPAQTFGYQAAGSDSVMQYAASPRWCQGSASGCGYDGGYLYFAYSGNSAASSTLNLIMHGATVNPSIPDGTNTSLHPGYVPDALNYSNYLIEYYTTGVPTPTFRDSDGHMTNWVVDGSGRPTQTQYCTASTNQGQQCTGQWLVTNESWDAANNLVASTEPRGYETDYAYDANGNTVAVGAPQVATSQGTFRPTKLYDYDTFNNVAAYCDETETHAAGVSWSSSLNGSDSLCTTSDGSGRHWRATYMNPSYQPFGQLASISTPLGYVRHFSYDPSRQGGSDYGLPTLVTGDSFQVDGSPLTPAQTFWYDAQGHLGCYSKGQGQFVLSYDALGRLTSEADPDDSSANAGSICGKTTGRTGWNTQTTYTYFSDGTTRTTQTPAERAGSVSAAYAYDLDGNRTTEINHFGCTPGNTCSGGATTKWYDGADRLVEVAKPQDPSDYYAYAWLTRYIYDLTQSGNVSISNASFQAHGNLFKTQEWLTGPGASAPSWTDLRGSAFDALDRAIASYTFSPSANTTLSTTTVQYDGSAASLGLLSSQIDPLGETTSFTYDALARQVAVSFAGDGGVTPAKTFSYDPNGRAAAMTGAVYGTQTTSYDADGRVSEVDESTNGSVTSPARVTYDYYPNGDRKALNVASSALTAAPLVTYSRRNDGVMTKESMQYGGNTSVFAWTYTDGGRKLSQTDPYTGAAMPSPQSPVNPGTTYAATTWSYDTTGQLTSLGLPETLNYNVGHDDEGHLALWSVGVTGSSTFSSELSFWNTTRGENFPQALSPPPPGSAFNSRPANGALVPAIKRAGVPPSFGSSPVFDPINAVVLGTTFTGTAVNSDGTTTSCGPVQSIDTYDAASRLVSRPLITMNPGTDDCGVKGPNPITWSYDAENHTIAQAAGTAQWGPDGKPYSIGGSGISDSLHYDGGNLLFVTDGQGNLTKLALGALADVAPNGQMTVWDRDSANMITSGHNNSLYYGVSFGGRKFGPFRGGDGPGTVPSGISPVVFNGSANAPSCTMQSCSIPGKYLYSRTEGFDWGRITIQGARVVDNATGQWTTPDAYAGNVHDPMTQKPFMWDRNNPYDYSDPSGFAVLRQPLGDGEGIIVAGVLAAGGTSPGTPGDPLPSDPSGLDPSIWSPAANPNPNRSRGSGGDWYYNARDKTWVRYDRGTPGSRGDHWHFFTTNPQGPKTPGGLPAPQNPIKVTGDRHLNPGDRPGGFSNHSTMLERLWNFMNQPLPRTPPIICCPIGPPILVPA